GTTGGLNCTTSREPINTGSISGAFLCQGAMHMCDATAAPSTTTPIGLITNGSGTVESVFHHTIISTPLFIHGGMVNSGGTILFGANRGYRAAPNGFICAAYQIDCDVGDTLNVGGVNYIVVGQGIVNSLRFTYAVHPSAV